MREITRSEFPPIHLAPGDSIEATIKEKTWYGRTKTLEKVTFNATEAIEIDTIVGFEGEELFGLKKFVGAVFGEKA